MGPLGIFAAVIIVIASLFVFLFNYQYKYWAKKKVPYLEPKFPYGNLPFISTGKTAFGLETKVWYDDLKKRSYKFGGVWSLARPVLVLVDPEYIKDVLSRDFDYFNYRDVYCNAKDEPISSHLFTIDSESGWKNLRQKLTPTFTSGKMKLMFDSLIECSSHMINALDKMATRKEDIAIQNVLQSFTTDVIGNVAFGIDSNSFENPDTEFRNMTQLIFSITFYRSLKLVFAMSFPKLAKKFGVTIHASEVNPFFERLVRNTAKYREETNLHRPDFLQLLIDIKNKTAAEDKPFTFDQIISNTMLFLVAGTDTSSATMTFVLFELARHPEIQEEVRTEINDVLAANKGKLTYESLADMKYLRQVMDESMRLHPPVLSLGRVCTNDYTFRDTNIVIEKGTAVAIPSYALHMDAEFYPDPEKFDPERFTQENKANRHAFVHLPFGEGPRNCIGLRFGIMQSKIGLVTILKKFKLSLSPSTKMPITINQNLFLLKSNETIYLNAERI